MGLLINSGYGKKAQEGGKFCEENAITTPDSEYGSAALWIASRQRIDTRHTEGNAKASTDSRPDREVLKAIL
ncbi:hypothetical protein [Pseudomaricurvus hydrocarbonicus]|uniref:hypothetical protein n=1 Tax=Pseudomaricurvus hydrocarbonicus TaxID=1470433 RepID=UPI00141EB2D3|nr:hypothetical protein [Aestuariicella hydrocarbonica]